MANSTDPDQLASELIWIYTVCKGSAYLGSAEQGFKIQEYDKRKKIWKA